MHPRDSSNTNQAATLSADTDPSALCPEVTVLVVAPNQTVPTPLEAALEADSSVDTQTLTSIGSVLQQLERADCLLLVADPPSEENVDVKTETDANTAAEAATTAENTEMPDSSAAVLTRLRNYAPDFPVVAVTVGHDSDAAAKMATAERDQRWTVHVPVTAQDSDSDLERVLQRMADLVEHHRLDEVVGPVTHRLRTPPIDWQTTSSLSRVERDSTSTLKPLPKASATLSTIFERRTTTSCLMSAPASATKPCCHSDSPMLSSWSRRPNPLLYRTRKRRLN